MRFNQSGHFYPQLPAAIRDLPVDLLRSHKVTRDPDVTRRGIQQYFAGELPVYSVPQRMGFQKWKTPPTQIGYGQNVISLLSAMQHQVSVISAAQPKNIPFADPIQAAHRIGATSLPMPTDRMDPNLRRGYVPLARGAVPLNTLTESAQLQQISNAGIGETVGNDARASALEEVEMQSRSIRSMAHGNTGKPWFLRGG